MSAPATHVINIEDAPPKGETKFFKMECNIRSFKIIAAEFFATTLLLFLGCMTYLSSNNPGPQSPMYGAIGYSLVVLFLVASFGHISGAHMNPTVTLSAVIFGRMSIWSGIMYFIVQIVGSIIGFELLGLVSPLYFWQNGVCVPTPNYFLWGYQSLIIEIILSAALVFVYCTVWDPVNGEKQDTIPLKIGFTMAALTLAGGPLTGASMNPSRSLATAITNSQWNGHWVYWVGPLISGTVVPILYKFVWLENKPTQLHNGVN